MKRFYKLIKKLKPFCENCYKESLQYKSFFVDNGFIFVTDNKVVVYFENVWNIPEGVYPIGSINLDEDRKDNNGRFSPYKQTMRLNNNFQAKNKLTLDFSKSMIPNLKYNHDDFCSVEKNSLKIYFTENGLTEYENNECFQCGNLLDDSDFIKDFFPWRIIHNLLKVSPVIEIYQNKNLIPYKFRVPMNEKNYDVSEINIFCTPCYENFIKEKCEELEIILP